MYSKHFAGWSHSPGLELLVFTLCVSLSTHQFPSLVSQLSQPPPEVIRLPNSTGHQSGITTDNFCYHPLVYHF